MKPQTTHIHLRDASGCSVLIGSDLRQQLNEPFSQLPRRSGSAPGPLQDSAMIHFPSHGLYAVTDGPRARLLSDVEQALAGGARLLQYRDLTGGYARRLAEAQARKRLRDAHGVPLLIIGDSALAQAVEAAGVHLGETAEELAEAR